VDVMTALFAGIGVGLLFSLVELPLPAPPTLPGILGAVGMFLGYQFMPCLEKIKEFYMNFHL
jgi:XapX domain-containing protein